MKKIIHDKKEEEGIYEPSDFMKYMEKIRKDTKLVSQKKNKSKIRIRLNGLFLAYKIPEDVELFYYFDFEENRSKIKLRGKEESVIRMEERILGGIEYYLNKLYNYQA